MIDTTSLRLRIPDVRRCLCALTSFAALSLSYPACTLNEPGVPCPAGHQRNDAGLCATVEQPARDPHDETRDDGGDAQAQETRCSSTIGARLEELMVNPSGYDASREFIEVLVEGEGVLRGWRLVIGDAISPQFEIALPELAAGRHLLADDPVATLSLGCNDRQGCLPNEFGTFEIYDCNDTLRQRFRWGAGTLTEEPDVAAIDEGLSAASCPGAPESFALALPSPTTATEEWVDESSCPVRCETPGWLVINEVLINPEGTDNGLEFIELHGPPMRSINGVILRGLRSDGNAAAFADIELRGRTDSEGLFVVGGALIEDREQAFRHALNNSSGALQLIACDDRIYDAIAWGGAAGGEGAPIAAPGAGEALGRSPDGLDIDDNLLDFSILPMPSPGLPNPW